MKTSTADDIAINITKVLTRRECLALLQAIEQQPDAFRSRVYNVTASKYPEMFDAQTGTLKPEFRDDEEDE